MFFIFILFSIRLTVACRLLSAFIYQCELNSRTNETLPSDPDEMNRVLRDKYPHKYPPHYRHMPKKGGKKTAARPSTKRSASKKPRAKAKKTIKP